MHNFMKKLKMNKRNRRKLKDKNENRKKQIN